METLSTLLALCEGNPLVSKDESTTDASFLSQLPSTTLISLAGVLSSIQLSPSISPHDVITWKHSPHYWPFVRGILWSPVDSLYKGQVMQSFDVLIIVNLKKLLRCDW